MRPAALDNFGRIDAVVNNAGILPRPPSSSTCRRRVARVIDVHLNGSFYVATRGRPRTSGAGSGA